VNGSDREVSSERMNSAPMPASTTKPIRTLIGSGVRRDLGIASLFYRASSSRLYRQIGANARAPRHVQAP
jgi:hypothetical protein